MALPGEGERWRDQTREAAGPIAAKLEGAGATMEQRQRKRAATGTAQNVTWWVPGRIPTARLNGVEDALGNGVTVEKPSFNFLKLCFEGIDLLILQVQCQKF